MRPCSRPKQHWSSTRPNIHHSDMLSRCIRQLYLVELSLASFRSTFVSLPLSSDLKEGTRFKEPYCIKSLLGTDLNAVVIVFVCHHYLRLFLVFVHCCSRHWTSFLVCLLHCIYCAAVARYAIYACSQKVCLSDLFLFHLCFHLVLINIQITFAAVSSVSNTFLASNFVDNWRLCHRHTVC